ncbi:MAG: MipA/OmpV family protein [Limnohabitans sp.]
MRSPWPLALCCAALAANAWAQDGEPASSADAAPTADASPSAAPAAQSDPPTRLIWSAGVKLRMADTREPGQLALRPMIGLRWGRWRAGPVDGGTWYRFGQVRTDNNLTYDWLDTARFRTSLSASIVNLQKDSSFDAIEPGFKTLRGKATLDYLGWSHWSLGLVLTQDLLNRGVGTTLSPSITYRQALSDDSTLLLSQSVTWASSLANATSHRLSPDSAVRLGGGWSSLDTSLTLRQRYTRHISWYAQLNRSQVTGALYPSATAPERSHWNAQAGVIYFGP